MESRINNTDFEVFKNKYDVVSKQIISENQIIFHSEHKIKKTLSFLTLSRIIILFDRDNYKANDYQNSVCIDYEGNFQWKAPYYEYKKKVI